MSKINDFILQCDEAPTNDERLIRYKRAQEKMLELQKKWEDIYPKTQLRYRWEDLINLDKETDKGGRHDWN